MDTKIDMSMLVEFLSVHHVASGAAVLGRMHFMKCGSLYNAARAFPRCSESVESSPSVAACGSETTSHKLLLVVSSTDDYDSIVWDSDFIFQVQKKDIGSTPFPPPKCGSLAWKLNHDDGSMCFLHQLELFDRFSSKKPVVGLVAAVAFPARDARAPLKREKIRAVFMIAAKMEYDTVIFGTGIADNEETMQIINEELDDVTPSTKVVIMLPP